MTKEQTLNAIVAPHVELGANYLSFTADIEDKDLAEVFKALTRMQGSTLFWVGDFLNTVELKKGAAYAKAYSETDYAHQTLWNAKSLCKKIPKELRVNLSFSHHKEALIEAKQNVAVAVDFLRKAEKAGQSVKQMRDSIRFALADSLPPKAEAPQVITFEQDMLFLEDAIYTIRRFFEGVTSNTPKWKLEVIRADIEALSEMARKACN